MTECSKNTLFHQKSCFQISDPNLITSNAIRLSNQSQDHNLIEFIRRWLDSDVMPPNGSIVQNRKIIDYGTYLVDTPVIATLHIHLYIVCKL